MCAILFFTGLRINELRQFDREVLLSLVDKGQAEILQAKTKAWKTILLPEAAKKVFKHLKVAIDTACPHNEDFLYTSEDPSKNKIVEFMNKRLKPYADEANLRLTSHSFRAGFITRLLRTAPIEKVRQIVGHSDIRSTQIYNRHMLVNTEKQSILDETFNKNDSEA
jgi:integrase